MEIKYIVDGKEFIVPAPFSRVILDDDARKIRMIERLKENLDGLYSIIEDYENGK
jgi:hypothetical protein